MFQDWHYVEYTGKKPESLFQNIMQYAVFFLREESLWGILERKAFWIY